MLPDLSLNLILPFFNILPIIILITNTERGVLMVTIINLIIGFITVLFIGSVLHRLAYFIGSNSFIITKISNFIEKAFLKIFSKLEDK